MDHGYHAVSSLSCWCGLTVGNVFLAHSGPINTSQLQWILNIWVSLLTSHQYWSQQCTLWYVVEWEIHNMKMCSWQICSDCVMYSSQHRPEFQWNVFNTLSSTPCRIEAGKEVSPSSVSIVFLKKCPVSVCKYQEMNWCCIQRDRNRVPMRSGTAALTVLAVHGFEGVGVWVAILSIHCTTGPPVPTSSKLYKLVKHAVNTYTHKQHKG